MISPVKLNFIIPGVARCGTTSMYYYLNQHPEIEFLKLKEPKFFSSFGKKFPHTGPGDYFVDKQTIRSYKNYNKLFSGLNLNKCIGEASSDYFYFHKHTISKLKQAFGKELKIIICIRNPVERAFSAYNNLIRDSREDLSFENALEAEHHRINENFDWMWYYTSGSFYYDGIKAFKENFDKVKIILNDDLSKHPKKTVIEIFEFLNVDTSFIPNTKDRYSISGRPKGFLYALISNRVWMTTLIRNGAINIIPRKYLERIAKKMFKKEELNQEIENKLINLFKEDIIKTQNLIDKDLSHWL